MIKETLHIANIKCGGCAHSIATKLSALDGVNDVNVDFEQGQVKLTYTSPESKTAAIQKLSNMGYPEATEENGLLMKARSYANCVVGKITK